MVGVLIKRERFQDREGTEGHMTMEAAVAKEYEGWLATTRNWEDKQERNPPRAFRGAGPCPHLAFRLLASRTV